MSGAPKPQLLMGSNLGPLGYYLQNAAWKNIFTKADSWRTSTSPTSPTWGTDWSTMKVNADGYPISIPQNGKYAHAVAGHQLYVGEYTLLWDGTGDVNVQGFSYNATGPNRKTFSVTKSSNTFFNVLISSSSAADPVKNIRVLIPGSEATYKTQPLNPDFMARMKNVGVVRYMDWGATNNSTHKTWTDRVTEFALQGTSGDGSSGGLGGTSYEMMCDTSNALNAHMWVCVPHQADDNYVTQMATLIKSRLNSSLHCYIEYSNELWNGQFQQTGWTQTQGKNAGLLNIGYAPGQAWCAGVNYSARRAAQIFKIFTTVFGDASRLVRIMASQNGGLGITDAWLQAMANTTINPLANDPTAKADAIAVAPYLGASGVQSTDTVASVIAKMNANIMSGDVLGGTQTQKQRADANGLRLIAYEGGQTLYTPSGNNANTLLAQVNRSTNIDAVYRTYFDKWFSITNDVFCHFNDCFNDDVSGGNFWGLIQKQNEIPAAQSKAKAFEDKAASFAGIIPVSMPAFGPVGSQFTPSKAIPGDIITLNGTNFAGVNKVTFNAQTSMSVIPVNTSTMSVQVVVPAILGSYTVTVSDGINSATSDDAITVSAPPLPLPVFSAMGTQLNPTHALSGTTLVLNGTNFNNITKVRFDSNPSVIMSPVSVSPMQVVVIVPPMPVGTNCTMSISDGANLVTSSDKFTYDTPLIATPPVFAAPGTQLSPTHALSGSLITLNGANFSKVVSVSFNVSPTAVVVSPTTTTATTVQVMVPVTLASGTVCSLSVSDGVNPSATSTDKFTLDAPVIPVIPPVVTILSTDWKNGFQNGFAFGVDQGSTHKLSASSTASAMTTDYVDGYKHGYSEGYLFGYTKMH